jgi:hypothetical protein
MTTTSNPYREPGKPLEAPQPDRTVPGLMKLLATLTGSGDQGLAVTVGYKRARVFIAQDESELSPHDWGYTVSTKICGVEEHSISAQGRTLELALESLAQAVVATLEERHRRREARAAEARMVLTMAGYLP